MQRNCQIIAAGEIVDAIVALVTLDALVEIEHLGRNAINCEKTNSPVSMSHFHLQVSGVKIAVVYRQIEIEKNAFTS